MGVFRIILVALLLAALLAQPLIACATDTPAATTDRATAFDAALKHVTGPASLDASTDEYDDALENLKALLPTGDPLRQAQLHSVYCGSSTWKDAAQGLAYSDDALRMARAVGDVPSQARALLCRSAYVMLSEGSQHGLAEIEQALDLLQDSPHQQLLGEVLEVRGDTLSLLGEQARAMLDFQRARAAYRAAGIEHEVEPLMFSIAVAYRRIGDWPQAQRYFEGALERMRDKRDWEGVATNLIQLGFLFDESGDPDRAAARFREAEQIAAEHQDPYSLNGARLGLAGIQITQGDPDAALATLALAHRGFMAEQDDSSDDMLALLGGQALASKGKHAEALAHYQLALPMIERNGNQRYLAMLYKARAASQEALGRLQPALADYKQYAALQSSLQGKMRLEQSRLLEYEYEIRRREFENLQLRSDAEAKQEQVTALERVRHWQTLALVLGALLVALLTSLATRQWLRSRRLRQMAMHDGLTGVANRSGIDEHLTAALASARASGQPLALLMLDLDHFKTINDRHGHAAGDQVLRVVSEAWGTQLRNNDLLGRFGGEEFLVICPAATPEQAMAIAHRLRDATSTLRFDEIHPELQVTVSIGVAQALPDDTPAALYERADAALYRAKGQGRDRVEP